MAAAAGKTEATAGAAAARGKPIGEVGRMEGAGIFIGDGAREVRDGH